MHEHIILNEGAGHGDDLPTREPLPANDTGPRLLPAMEFCGTGPARGDFEDAVRVEYQPPGRRAA